MTLRMILVSGLALTLTSCATTGGPATPLQARWGGQPAGSFFAAYGPPLSDAAGAGGTTLYGWRGGYINRRACQVELTVSADYRIQKIRTVLDRPDPKGGPSHCEKVLDAAK